MDRVWATNDTAVQLERINNYSMPFNSITKKVLKAGLIDAWRYGRTRARVLVSQGKKRGRWLKRRSKAVTQEGNNINDLYSRIISDEVYDPQVADPVGTAFILAAQELTADETAYAVITKTYGEWVDSLGEELWQRKVSAVKGVMQEGLDAGWSLREIGHYEKSGSQVSAWEATGGVGGKTNVVKGYRYVQDTPGVLNKMSIALQPFSVPGWQMERIARTEHTRAMNDGMMSIYANEDTVTALEFVAVIDSRTTVDCAMLDGTIFSMEDPRLRYFAPPLHGNCRSELYPVFAWEMQEATADIETSVTLFSKNNKPFQVSYVPTRVDPDILHTIRPRDDSAGIRAQLMTRSRATAMREGFNAKSAADTFGEWMHPRSASLAAGVSDTVATIIPGN